MNENCKCDGPGLCARHQINKTSREFDLCKGVANTGSCGLNYWVAWENGKLGATAPAEPILKPKGFRQSADTNRRGLGDTVSRGIAGVSGGRIKPCIGCKDREAVLNHWLPEEMPPIEPMPFTGPIRRNFLYHVYPDTAHREIWQRNIDNILKRMDMFNGHRAVGIVTAKHLDPPEMVMDAFKGEVDDFYVAKNVKKLREVITFVPLLEKVESMDPNDVTFCAHTKGVTHNDGDWTTVHRWGDLMYRTCLDDWPAVEKMLESKAMAGSFKSYGQFRTRKNHRWHYSGTFYWFRNKDVFSRNWRYVDQRYFGNESWPGLMFKPEETGCLFLDHVGDPYNGEYWENTVQPEFDKWRIKNERSKNFVPSGQ
jgi:hypothetical protein